MGGRLTGLPPDLCACAPSHLPLQEPWLNQLVAVQQPLESERDGYVAHPSLLNPNLLDAQVGVCWGWGLVCL